MLGLDTTTHVALGNELRNLPLHSGPPKSLAEILIHLRGPGMNGQGRIMGFAENQIPQLHVLWNHKALSEPHNTKLIFGEALGCSVLDVFLDVAHSNIRLLGGLDSIHQGWLHHQGSEGTMLNQP